MTRIESDLQNSGRGYLDYLQWPRLGLRTQRQGRVDSRPMRLAESSKNFDTAGFIFVSRIHGAGCDSCSFEFRNEMRKVNSLI
jgi:hypothetical protein